MKMKNSQTPKTLMLEVSISNLQLCIFNKQELKIDFKFIKIAKYEFNKYYEFMYENYRNLVGKFKQY